MPCCLVQCLAQRHARICLSGIQCPIQPGKAATTLALSLCWVQFCSFCPITSLHSPPSVSALRSPLSASAASLQATEPPNRRTTSFPRILCIVSRQSPVPLPPAPRLANVPLCRRAEPFHAGTRVLRFFLLFFLFLFRCLLLLPPGGLITALPIYGLSRLRNPSSKPPPPSSTRSADSAHPAAFSTTRRDQGDQFSSVRPLAGLACSAR